MRRAADRVADVLLAVAHPPLAAAPAPPARVLAFAREFRFSFSRLRVSAGPVRIQLKNLGEDDHDLRVVDAKGVVRVRTRVLHPDDLGDVRVRLPRGRYRFYCSLADHEARGMAGTFTVLPPRPRAS